MRIVVNSIIPDTKPPMCAHHATPPPDADAVEDIVPLKN